MANKAVEDEETPAQRRFTLQLDKGYRQILDEAVKAKRYGLKASAADIVNEALRRMFEADGLLKGKK